jgi:tetraacyldisaccharide 4'-kinase
MRKIGLLPFTILYWLITYTRNILFDVGILKATIVPGKSISVGNLSVGGSGKTPMVMYLTSLLQLEHSIQILSRGYGRKTTGYRHVNSTDDASTVGDEPLSYFQKFAPKTDVFVCEKRQEAIVKMKEMNPSATIILDDAFQHRYVKPGLQLLLTPYQDQFLSDWHLPSGNLRESKAGAHRADAIILTKCPDLTEDEMMTQRKRYESIQKPVFFSRIEYADFQLIGIPVKQLKSVLLVTGISSSTSLKSHLMESYKVEELKFGDHHAFTQVDIQEIHRKFDTFASKEMAIVTTEKDLVKIEGLLSENDRQTYPWYVLPITVKMENEEAFNSMIKDYVRSN